jgi:hypothetical protein
MEWLLLYLVFAVVVSAWFVFVLIPGAKVHVTDHKERPLPPEDMLRFGFFEA